MKKFLLLLLLLLTGCKQSIPTFINPTIPIKNKVFTLSDRCTYVFVIWVPANYFNKNEFSKIIETTIPVSMDIIIKNNKKKRFFYEKDVSFKKGYTKKRDDKYLYGFYTSLGVLDKGNYYLSTIPNTLNDDKKLSKTEINILTTCKRFSR